MTRQFLSIILLGAAGAFTHQAIAQSDPTPRSQAPAGQGPGVSASAPESSGMSTKSRSGVKAQTKDAGKAGTLQPAGQATQSGDTPPVKGKSMTGSSSTKSRAAVKSDTKAARGSGSLQPAGETPKPTDEAPKK